MRSLSKMNQKGKADMPTTEELVAESEAVMNAPRMDTAELMRNAKEAIEPGDASGSVVHKPSSDTPFGLTISEMKSAGWVTVWDNRTGEPSLVNRNMLGSQLEKRRDDGSFVFTTEDPGITPTRGVMKCILHAEHPDRPNHEKLGFPTCPKSNLRTALDVRLHAQHRHKMEWASLEEQREEQVREEERQVRQALIASSNSGAPRTVTETTPPPAVTKTCEICGSEVSAKSKSGISLAMTWHRKKEHGG